MVSKMYLVEIHRQLIIMNYLSMADVVTILHGRIGQVILRIVFLVGLNVLLTAAVAVVLLLVVWVRTAKSLPELKGWHVEKPESEFCSADAVEGFSLEDYLAQEQRVFDELAALIDNRWESEVNGVFSR